MSLQIAVTHSESITLGQSVGNLASSRELYDRNQSSGVIHPDSVGSSFRPRCGSSAGADVRTSVGIDPNSFSNWSFRSRAFC